MKLVYVVTTIYASNEEYRTHYSVHESLSSAQNAVDAGIASSIVIASWLSPASITKEPLDTRSAHD